MASPNVIDPNLTLLDPGSPLMGSGNPLAETPLMGMDTPSELLPIATSEVLFGDINSDGVVNILDISSLIGRFGSSVEPDDPGDLDADGLIGIPDLQLVSGQFGNTVDSTVPDLTASLVNDTGADSTDALTGEPILRGTLIDPDDEGVASFTGSFNGQAPSDLLSEVQPDGSFLINQALTETLNGGQSLSDGLQTLTLSAIDSTGNATITSYAFTLDTTAPQQPVFDLAPDSDSDPIGDQQTTVETVALLGQTDANAIVELVGTSEMAIADGTGQFQFTDVTLALGDNSFTLRATDPAGNFSEASQTFTRLPLEPVNQPPVFEPVGPLTVMPGERLEIQLMAVDPEGEPITFSLESDGPIPTGRLEADGTLVFSPTPEQLGAFQFTVIATDGQQQTNQLVTLDVVADPVTTTRISGVVLDTNLTPLADIPIELGGFQTQTLADGSFSLEIIGDLPDEALRVRGDAIMGDFTYPFIAEELDLLLGRDPFTGVNNVIERPIFLPAIDLANAVAIDPGVNTTVTTDAIPGAEVFVAAGTLEDMEGNPFSGQLSITEVPRDLTPASLPENLLPDILVTIQPAEMIFNTPAPLALPNEAGYAPGTVVDLWSINPETGAFEIVGSGEVSADGSVINTISGGIRNSSWHFFAPPPEQGEDPEENDRNEEDGCDDCKGSGGFSSVVEFHSGAVVETHELVSYQSLGVDRGLTLVYDSLRADPQPIVHFGYDNIQAGENRRLVAELTVSQGDFEFQLPGFAGGTHSV